MPPTPPLPRKVIGSTPPRKRQAWDKAKMQEAVTLVREKKMGLKNAAKRFAVPKTTLQRLVRETQLSPENVIMKKLGRKPILPENLEKELMEYLLMMESKYYGFTRMDVRRMAYQLAIRNNVQNNFRDECAGRAWLDHFLRRYKSKLSLRRPTGTSYARSIGFTRERVGVFYDLLQAEYEKHNYPPDSVWNVDETGISVVQTKIPEVITSKGKCQVCSLTAAERGSLVTVICSMSAGGSFVPPMLIFPRVKMTDTLMRGAPPGSIGRAHPSGWVQSHLFTEWFKHFIAKTKPTENSPILLILDGHFSHTRNLDVIDLARKNYVSIISLPFHTTHKLQPLDRTFMSPLKVHYSENIRQWMLHQNKPVGPYDIADLFGKAYLRCASASNAVNGFKVTGICPFDRNVFSDADFIAGETMNEEVSDETEKKKKTSTRGRKVNVSSLVTGSPYKEKLKSYIHEKKEIARGRGRGRGRGRASLNALVKNHYEENLPSTSGLSRGRGRGRGRLKLTKKRSERDETDEDTLSSCDSIKLPVDEPLPDQKVAFCLFCEEKFSDDVKGGLWIQCFMCSLWVHNKCAGAEKAEYVCDYCR